MNEEIPFEEMRVMAISLLGDADEQLGILSRQEALQAAQDMGNLDLILVNDKSDPPICKIVNYSKFKYMQDKKARAIKKQSKASELKEVKMSIKINDHDYQVRRKNAEKFLKQGNRVKCTVTFRGREAQHTELGNTLIDRIAADLEKTCYKDGQPKKEGRNLSCILAPREAIVKSVTMGRRKEAKAKKQQRAASLKEKLENEAILKKKREEEAAAAAALEEKRRRKREAAALAAAAALKATEVPSISAPLSSFDNTSPSSPLPSLHDSALSGFSDKTENNEEEELDVDKILSALSDPSAGVDDDDDDVDDVAASLDALLGGDGLSDDLFK